MSSSSSSSSPPPLDIFIRIPLLPNAVHIEDSGNELRTVSDIQHRLLGLVAAAQDGEEGRHHPRRRWGSCRLIRGGKELRGPTVLSTLGLSRGEHLHGLLIEDTPTPPTSSSPSSTQRTATVPSTIPTRAAIIGGGDGVDDGGHQHAPLTSRERLIAIRRLQLDARLAASRREADGGNDEINPLDAVAAFNRLFPQDGAAAADREQEVNGVDAGGGREGVDAADAMGSDIQRRRRRPGTMPAPRPTPTTTPTTPTPTPAANSIDVQEIIQRAMREPRWRLAAGCIVGFLLHVLAVPLIFFGFIVSTSTDVKGYTAQYWRGTNGGMTSSNILRHHIQTVSEKLSVQQLTFQKEAGDVSVIEMNDLTTTTTTAESERLTTTQNNGDLGTRDANNNNQLTQSYEGDGSLFKQLLQKDGVVGGSRGGGEEAATQSTADLLHLRVPPSFFAPHRGSTYSTILEPNTDDYLMRSGHETGTMLFYCGIVMGAVVNVGFATFATFSADTLIVASPQ